MLILVSPFPANPWLISPISPPAPPPSPAILTITLDKTLATTGETITATAEIRQDGQLVDKTGTYYVPVLDVSGNTALLLSVTFTGGQGSVNFSFPNEGTPLTWTRFARCRPRN
ncbi:hypothetical protein [Nitrosococcus wardiae]|uniref:Uncharacterized protein n=1 Tax=Nitrosococcus wardiae TaxID=1814290 RepID=A0A4V1AWC9_9GAMM|nr:hypothetical protein [Nitrosococcus wardiae]QBQ56195.1 hypothetical protein E3U44_18070 [Nitrosococcus wardiae]